MADVPVDTSSRDARGEWQPESLPKPGPLFQWPPRPIPILKFLFTHHGLLEPFTMLFKHLEVQGTGSLPPSSARRVPASPRCRALAIYGLMPVPVSSERNRPLAPPRGTLLCSPLMSPRARSASKRCISGFCDLALPTSWKSRVKLSLKPRYSSWKCSLSIATVSLAAFRGSGYPVMRAACESANMVNACPYVSLRELTTWPSCLQVLNQPPFGIPEVA